MKITQPNAGQYPGYVAGPTGTGSSGLNSVTDGTTTANPVSSITTPPGGITDNGSGDISLEFIPNRNGAIEYCSTVATSGAAQTLDWSIANEFDITLSTGCTFTFSNVPNVAGTGSAITIFLRGSQTTTWPGTVTWLNGVSPTGSTLQVAVINTVDGGTTFGGTLVGSALSTLASLTDVSLSSLANADRLRYSTSDSKWHNSALIWTPLTVYDPTTTNYLPLVDGSGNAIMAEA